ncbi:hypothetical protein EG329_012067 [Mollisiaceae sp. DMI_Dod_QoI]|nr:hypothetical protein EG329_012067 [Helotiales sp. DMI_Dod_QoI]
MYTQRNLNNPDVTLNGRFTLVPRWKHPDPPPCVYDECMQQYRTMKEQESAEWAYHQAIDKKEAADVCKKMVLAINDSRSYLQQQLAANGTIISKRWKKKTLKNREALLKSVDPGMHEKKWHEGHFAYENRYGNYAKEAREHRNIHLLPYMSLENLKEEPSRVIKLLHYRSRYSPPELAAFDNRQLTFGWTTGSFKTIFSDCCVVMYGDRYGDIVPWDRQAVHRGDIVGFPRAQLILEAQAYLMKILRRLVEHLVEGLPNDALCPTPTGGLPVFHSDTFEYTSSFINEAFSVSPGFDLDKLSTISRTRLNMAEDHFAQLQTDPNYMRRYVQLILQAEFSRLPEQYAYALSTGDLDHDAWTLRHWVWIDEAVEQLKVLRTAVIDQIYPGQALPRKYREKLVSLEALILKLMDVQSRHIQCVLPQRPGFRDMYTFEYSPNGRCLGYLKDWDNIPDRAAADAELFVKDPLTWSLTCLTTSPDSSRVLDHTRYFGFLEEYLNKATLTERSRLDETLFRKISDLAAFNEILVMIRSHRPRAVQGDVVETKDIDDGRGWRYMSKELEKEELEDDGEIVRVKRSLQEVPLNPAILGNLLKEFMDEEVPEDKFHRSWILKDSRQRKKLRAFWDAARTLHKKKLQEHGFNSADIKDDLSLITADTHPDTIAAVEAERKEIRAATTASTTSKITKFRVPKPKKSKTLSGEGVVEPVQAPLTANKLRPKEDGKDNQDAEIQSEWGITPENTKPASEIRVKTKTRGELASIEHDLEDLNINQPAVDEDEPPQKVLVKKSALEVLTSLFPDRDQGSKSVLWDSFVDAMAKVGFMCRRSGGSAVTFEPSGESKWYGKGSIAFHRPHPDSKIDSVMLLLIGKRMKKWFGWGKETFELGK